MYPIWRIETFQGCIRLLLLRYLFHSERFQPITFGFSVQLLSFIEEHQLLLLCVEHGLRT